MIKGNYPNYQIVCDKCGKWTKEGRFAELYAIRRSSGWYVSTSPSKNCQIDICDQCAKKYTLATL